MPAFMQRDVSYRARYSAPHARFAFVGDNGREIKVVASDGGVDRYGDILVPSGCRLENFRRNPVVLAQHDSSMPVARCSSISASASAVMATITFPDPGVSALSDQYLALVRSKVLSAVSVGFLSISRVPLASGSYKYLEWELLELSIVSVPALPSALVVERGLDARRRDRDLRHIAEIERRTAGIAIRPAPEPDPMMAIRLAHARQEHERALARRDSICRVLQLAAMW